MSEQENENQIEFPNPEEMEMITVSVVYGECGKPSMFLNGNVDRERAVVLFQMAAQVSLEDLVFDYMPPGLGNEEDDEEEEDLPEQEAADRLSSARDGAPVRRMKGSSQE